MGAREGLLNVWVPHATAGLAVIETGAGSDADLLAALRDLLPPTTAGGTGTAARATAATTCCPRSSRRRCRCRCSTGGTALGTWQSVCLIDTNTDNPVRSVRLSFLPG